MSPQSIHQFAEKVALISDASSPVGRAVAMQLALQGTYVIGLFPSGSGSVNELVELGTLAHGLDIDPSTIEGSKAAAAEVDRIFGRLDLLINCLKFRAESEFENVTETGFADTFRRNLGSVQFLSDAVFSLMKDRPKPKVVNLAWKVDIGFDPLFAASQAGVVSLTGSMKAKLPSNFRINCVEVSETAAPFTGTEENLAKQTSVVAPDDIARAVLFLLSAESAGMNGQTVRLG